MELLAKTDGTTLKQHTQDVRDEAASLVKARPFVAHKYQQRTGHDLASLLDESARWHDAGKEHSKWQNACRADYEESKRTGRNCGTHLRRAGIRHEIASLAFMKDRGAQLPLCGWTAVAAHHRKLAERHEKRWQDDARHADFWHQFKIFASRFDASDRESFDRVLEKRYEYDGPRAWLQLADGRASAKEGGDVLPQLEEFRYNFPHDKPRGVQELITRIWDKPFAILRAPTGAGKTDAALLWAQHQIKENRADRLVIAMPTRFTSNALSIAVADNLSARGLYHSSAHFVEKERRENADDFDKDVFEKEMLLARLLETPVTVTTLDHLCIALTGAREDHHGIFWGLSHSCVVIDEADFYDDFTQRNMIVLLHALRVLDVPVLVMSATVPESARELYALSGFEAKEIHEDASDTDRVRCRIERKGRVRVPEDIEEILRLVDDDAPLIIYANTVERAQAYRQWFEDNKFDEEDVVLYHSRFCEPDKVEIEQKLYKMMGREAWKNGTQRGVAILTQIGELSVNISADQMLSDLCPIDRLTQRAGRLARFKERFDGQENVIGNLYVVLPTKSGEEPEDEWYPAPYGNFIGNKWQLTHVLRQSNEKLEDGDYSPRRFADLVNELYPSATSPSPRARDNARALENSFVNNWLITQFAELESEDDEQTHIWKSRDIAPQQTVYVGVEISTHISNDTPSLDLSNRFKFREWQLKHGVQIYGYQLAKAIENSAVEKRTFNIGEDSEIVYLVNVNYYDLNYGLRLNRETFEEEQ